MKTLSKTSNGLVSAMHFLAMWIAFILASFSTATPADLLPDLTVEVSAPANATVGVPFDYSLTVRNRGNMAAADIDLDFYPPDGLSVSSISASSGFVGGDIGPFIYFMGGTLEPGASATLTVTVIAAAAGTYATMPDVSFVDLAEMITESDETNNGSGPAVSTIVTASLQPTLFTWTSPVTGNWSDSTKWTNELASGNAPSAAGQADYTLDFNTAGTYTASNDLNAGFLLNRLNFGGSTVTLAGNGLAFTANGATLPQIYQDSVSAVAISTPLNLTSDLTVGGNGNGPITVSGAISGTGGLTKTSPGTLTLLGANTYGGGTTVYAGTLVVTGAGTLGAPTGGLTVNGSGALVVIPIPFPTRTVGTVNLLNGGQITGPGTLTATAFNVESGLINARLAGTGATLAKSTTGTVTLRGVNSYTGNTVVSAGTLVLADNAGLKFVVADASNNKLTGAGAATLDGDFTIDTSAVTVVSGSWTLVDVATKSFGTTFTVAGAGWSESAGVWTKVDVAKTWTFTEASGMLALSTAGVSDYDTWAATNITNIDPAANATSGGDPDGDGVPNKLEYAFGLDPLADSSANPVTVPFDMIGGTFSYTRLANSGLTYTVLTSTDMVMWAPAACTEVVGDPIHGVQMVEVTLTADPVTAIRLSVSDSDLFNPPYNLMIFTSADAASSTVAATPTSVPADGTSIATITVTLKDATGEPVAGKVVSLASNRGAVDIISSASGLSNASGVVTITVRSSTLGSAVFTVTDTTDNVVLAQTASVTFLTVPNPSGTPPVSGFARWFDASQIVGKNNGDPVNTWPDLSGNDANATVPSGNAAPTYVANAGTESGLPALYFAKNGGAGNSGALRFTRDTNIRTVFSVFKGNCFLLTDANAYDFHRPGNDNPTDPLWADFASGNITGGATYVNGLLVGGASFSMPTDLHNGFNLVEVVTTGNVQADSFNKDRVYHSGNQYQAEVIIYDRVLSEVERVSVRSYLMNKWFDPGNAAAITSFGLPDNPAVISGTNISLTVPYGTNLTNIAPTFTLSLGATCDHVSGASYDFTNPVTYTVLSENLTAKAYTVTVIVAARDSTYQRRVIASGPLAYWPLDESQGLVAYDNVSSHHGTYSDPGATFGVTGPMGGNAVSFSGAVGVGMRIPYTATLCPDTAFSVELWAKPAVVSAGTFCIASNVYAAGNREGWIIYEDGNNFSARLFNRNGTNFAANLLAPIDGGVKWYHLVLTWDEVTKSARFYNDGVLAANATLASYFGNAAGFPFTVGVRSDGGFPWNGSVAHLAFYNRTLTVEEIQAHLTNMYAPNYTITASAGAGGLISPVGEVLADEGTSQTFSIEPDSGYVVQDVLVDGASIGAVTSYTFHNVTAPHIIVAAFVTAPPPPPLVTTGTASGIAGTAAVLNGTVNPNGAATTARFEYGLTESYGNTANVTLSPDDGSTAQAVSANISGLQAESIYHYRLTANSNGGSSFGGDMTFGTETTQGSFKYTTANGAVTITKYAGPGGTVDIPGTINDMPVTAIGSEAFRDCINLTDVTIPDSVTSIGDSAFRNCPNLASIIIPASVSSIGSYAFASYNKLKTMVFMGNAPSMGTGVFVSASGGLTVQYFNGKTGFTSPVWMGRPSVNLGEPAPVLVVEQPAGNGLTSGSSTVNFGSSLAGVAVPLAFTIRNTGFAPLTGIVITKDGSNPADYMVTTAPATPVAAGGNTTFVVTFTPGGPGTRTAALHIASNDSSSSPFTISVNGTGIAPPSSAKDMLSFGLPGNPGIITGNNIVLTVPYGTVLTGLAPSFTVSALATGTPASGTARNFTTPQTYTVTAENGTTREYTVTVNVAAASSAKDLLGFVFPGLPAPTIVGTSINLSVPYGTNVTALAPTYTVTATATGSPVSGTVRDFTTPQSYTVTAQDGSSTVFTVLVNVTPASSAKDILGFVFPGLPAATIEGTNIILTVPYATSVAALAPSYTVSPLAKGSPVSGTVRNFTTSQTYTITAEDLTTKSYTVTVNVAPASSAKDILTFVFPGLPACTITGTNISVTVPYGTDVTRLAPTYTLSPLARGAPSPNSVRNFTTPQTYAVTAEDGSSKVYVVTVTVGPPSPAKEILTFAFPGLPAASIAGTGIDVTVPYGTVVTNLAPTFTVSANATASPVSGAARNFTTPQTYTVTAEDGSTQVYTVAVNVAPASPAKDILTFGPGAIIAGNSIVWTVPYGTALTNLAPTYAVSPLATGFPAPGTTRDFTTPQTYTVTAQDNSTKTYAVTVAVASASPAKDILAFSVPGIAVGTIAGNSIGITVPYGTDVTSLAPVYTVSAKATGAPLSGAAMNFTSPQTYTITAENGSTKTYSVTVTVASPSPAKEILGFVFPGLPVTTIAGTNISVTVPYGTDVTSLAPTYTISPHATGTPVSGTARNFGTPRTYTVTAQDGSTKVYSVTVNVAAPSSAKEMLSFVFPGLPATKISGTNMNVTAPYGTNVTALAPTYTVSPFAKGTPASETVRNFTTPQAYTVTAQDGSTKVYTVTVMRTAASSAKDILTFGPGGVISGTTIVLPVPYGTNLTTLAPTYTLSPGATCDKASGSIQNLSSPQTYTVTAQDGSAKVYTVTVAVAPVSTAKDILTCNLGALGTAEIAGTDIVLFVPTGTVVSNLAPTFTISPLATLIPASGSANNFTHPVVYTVTAQDGSTKDYSVSVRFVPSANANLSNLTVSDGTLDPAFDPSTSAYAASVPYRSASISVTATAADARSTLQMRVNGGSSFTVASGNPSVPLDLNVGMNRVAVVVTAEDSSIKTYVIDIARALEIADPLYRYDFNSQGVWPNLAVSNDSGRALADVCSVAGGVLRQRTSGADGTVEFAFPDASLTGGGFNPGRATFAEARLNVISIGGIGGIGFAIADGAHRYSASFASGGVYVGNDAVDAAHFVPLNLAGFHTYRLESPPDSDTLYFFYDGQVVFVTTGQGSSRNGFEWGDGVAPSGNFGNADWDYVEFGQTSSYILPSFNPNLGDLALSSGKLSPSFYTGASAFSANVPNATAGITVTPTVAVAGTTVRVNGTSVVSGTTSDPIGLSVGSNLITIVSTAADGITNKTYTVAVTRAAPVEVATHPADGVTAVAAVLHGTVNPNGSATAYFEYGPSTAYGYFTAGQVLAGTSPIDAEASLSGLAGSTLYHYRMVADSDGVKTYGSSLSFTTAPSPPVAATGTPVEVTNSSAKLVGLVNPRGLPVQVHFEYGLTELLGLATPVQDIPAGNDFVDVMVPVAGLLANATYHCQLVAETTAGRSRGSNVGFVVTDGTEIDPPTGSPTARPDVTTVGTAAIKTDSVSLRGSVNPNGGATVAQFEYGTTESYGQLTAIQDVGNGDSPAEVSLPVDGLSPGTHYFYRCIASNSKGTAPGAMMEFTTKFPPPLVETGDAAALTTTSARITGTVRARNTEADVFFDYGTDPANLTRSVQATPHTVSGDVVTAVSAVIDDLVQGAVYYYRVRAESTEGGTGTGEPRSLEVAMLSGLLQRFPDELAVAERQGSVQVTLSPAGIGGGWRLVGEQQWRLSGVPATGMTSGDRIIEFRAVPGYVQPANETVVIVSGEPMVELDRTYTPSGVAGNGSLTVTLKPESLAAQSVAAANRAQWRLLGETDSQWRDSGVVLTGLVAGNQVIEFKPVTGRGTPAPVTVWIADGETSAATITYFVAQAPLGTPPGLLEFEAVSTRQDRPYAYVGQIRSEVGSSTGFVVRPRVVATAGHVVFDDGTLAATRGVQWLFQRDRDVQEPLPQMPRGFFLMTGYAAQREADNSPGTSTPQSQNLDAAALFFFEDAGRGGFSGYLASDALSNEFLLSSALKTLVGYPVDGIPAAEQGRMRATPLFNISFAQAFGRTYTTSEIRSSGGNSGGPLCVQYENGNYYPAAIYLGGTAQTVVRAIDSDVAALFGLAEVSGGSGVNSTGGGVTETGTAPIATPTEGSLQVLIDPAAARNAGAGWKINLLDDYQPGGFQLDNITPDTYTVQFPTVSGFMPPAPQSVAIQAGVLTILTFAYEAIILPPVITSSETVTGTRNQFLSYQISATNSPDFYSVWGALPAGLSFDAFNGSITGTLQEAGKFAVTVGATNAGGAATRSLVISSLPVLSAQAATVFYEQAMNYRIVSSESAVAATYTAANLPAGLTLDPSSGRITGTPLEPGVFQIPITVTRKEATAASILTLNVTGTRPLITLQPVTNKTIEYGGSTTLTVGASGLPAPAFQWYRGASGVTSNPVAGATSTSFTTPPLTTDTSYWARAMSISGSADSAAAMIHVLPSANANLANLTLSASTLTPAFNAGILTYRADVPYAASSITLTPAVEVLPASVRINGIPVASGSASGPVPLSVGPNMIPVEVTAADGITTRTYTVTVTRAGAASATTGDATGISDVAATLNGTVVPNGAATVFFQYGQSESYGNATPGQNLSAMGTVPVQAVLSGLFGNTRYYYRIAVTTAAGTIYGDKRTFTTASARPLVVTGSPAAVTDTGATLIGAVNPNGSAITVYFEYGRDAGYGFTTAPQSIDPGSEVVDVRADIPDLTTGATYHFRIVATFGTEFIYGDDVSFNATAGSSSGDGRADDPPIVTTGDATDVTVSSAVLQGTVNPNDGITVAYFQYGLTAAYGSKTREAVLGNGSAPVNVTLPSTGLLPGTSYHFQLVASNSKGTSYGSDKPFTTGFLPPLVTTGDAAALTATSVRVSGTVQPRGGDADVWFDYGTDGLNWQSVRAFEVTVPADQETPVSTNLLNLRADVTYYFRVRAISSGVTGVGSTESLQLSVLLGLIQGFPRQVPAGDHAGQVLVNLVPSGLGGWRFVGETQWRPGGVVVTGLTTGVREIEFQPLSGYIQPQREAVGVVSEDPVMVLNRTYYVAGLAGTGTLQVLLEPDALADQNVPVASRAQWRLVGDNSAAWRNSGEVLSALLHGSYLVECKPVPGRNTPSPASVVVQEGQPSTVTITYFPASAPTLNPPIMVPFEIVSTTPNLPYAYVGQFRSSSGSYSGFVVKPRVVATVGQAVLDEATLTVTTGMEWLLQRDRGTYEPEARIPRGFYLFDGYAAQRSVEGTPGTLSIDSQNLNVAALYFPDDAGRGGFSGFLASDQDANEFLLSSALKTLVGYPMNGIAPENQGRMHATAPANAAFVRASGRTYTTAGIRGSGGMTGGPLCVQYGEGAYYPAGIYVGGVTRCAVRAIDSSVIDLFTRAEVSGNGGDNNTGGGITHTSFTSIGSSTLPGALKVIIEPEAACTAGAAWLLQPETTYLDSGAKMVDLNPASYVLQLKTVTGFQPVPLQTALVVGGQITTIRVAYVPDVSPLQAWRLKYFGTIENIGEAADSADPDGDGKPNIDEFVALTHPKDGSDFFRILTTRKDATSYTVTASGKEARTYVLERRVNLNSGPWVAVDLALAADDMVTLRDSNPPPNSGFYRIRVSAP